MSVVPKAMPTAPTMSPTFATVCNDFPELTVSAYLGSVQRTLPQACLSELYLLRAMSPVTVKTARPATPTPAAVKPATRVPAPVLLGAGGGGGGSAFVATGAGA